MAIKNYCSIHHLYYSGNECSMCREERTADYITKYGENAVTSKQKEKEAKDRAINEDDISKLMEKFNRKVGK